MTLSARIISLLFILLVATPLLASEGHNRFFEHLANADADWMRAFAAPSLPADSGADVLADLASRESLSPHAAYRVSSACKFSDLARTCAVHDLRRGSLQADPENLAAYLLAMDDAEESERLRLLNQAAQTATHIDTYWMRGGLEMLERTKNIAFSEDQTSAYPDMSGESAAALRLFGYYIAALGPSYQELTQLCAFESLLEPQRRQVCLRIGRVMQEASNTVIDLWIGNLLERRVLLIQDPDSAEALRKFRQRQAVEIAFHCFHQAIQIPENPDQLEEPIKLIERLSKHGEYEGNRIHAQAIYAKYPERFETDPTECSQYPQLPDQALLALLENYDGYPRSDQYSREQVQARAALKQSASPN